MKKTIRLLSLALLVILTMLGTAFANDRATHTISVTIPEKVEIILSRTNIDFGFVMDGPEVLEDSLDVTYRCNKSGGDWQLTISGTDFTSATSPDTFSVDYLKWKRAKDGMYQDMPKTTPGEVGAVVATGNTPGYNTTKIYYQMTMPTDVHAGQYTNTVTYSLIVP